MEAGQVVFSKRGRDRGTAYVVMSVFTESGKEFAWLADGKTRTADKPKKKKTAHIQPTNAIVPLKESGDLGVINAYLRKSLEEYNKPCI